ncbi:nuclear factor 7, brain-like [Aplochiton taeniatus]
MAEDRSALEDLHTELTCSICLDLFREPVILECGHHFCRVCITQCWDTKADDLWTCPQCRKSCVPKLRPNSLLCNVVESVRRVRAMNADGLLGGRSGVQEYTEDREAGSSMSSVGSGVGWFARPAYMCEEHEEKLKLYCVDDQLAICLVCGMSRDHKMHNVIPINEACENYKEKLSAALERVQMQTEEATLYQRLTKDKIVVIKEHTEDLEEQVCAEFRGLREFLRLEEERVREKLRAEKEKRLDQLGKALARTTEQISRLESTADQLRDKLGEEENPDQLKGIEDFILRAETMFERPQEADEDLQPGVFLGPLQYHIWKKMGSIIQPAVTEVVLDADTAYPRLWVSPCGSGVRVGDIQPNLPDNPERFTRYNIVLGAQALAAGRHYWEVQVGAKTAWGLGVAAASVNRKAEINLCPDDGFWTVGLRDRGDGRGEYEACTNAEESRLSPARPPRRVGVYLDYERGELAFYDAGDMTHLFSFSNAAFSEPVFPYFNPWPIINGHNREPLTVVVPSF